MPAASDAAGIAFVRADALHANRVVGNVIA
jgi:hypothetical protein